MRADLPEGFDPRLTPARPDLADEALRGFIDAPRYASPARHAVVRGRAGLHPRPDPTAPFDTVLLFGELFRVLEMVDGWAWGQAVLDGYVGYVATRALAPAPADPPDHAVWAMACQLYREPKLKQAPAGILPFAARVRVVARQDGYARIDGGLWAPEPLLRPLSSPAADWVSVAERFGGVPYVWGGRSSSGVDCSGLVQLALQAAGKDCPRDTDMQAAMLGRTLAEDAPPDRGDLVFWRGHVGIMTDAGTLLHANAHHMATASEPLADAIARIAATGEGAVTRRARLAA